MNRIPVAGEYDTNPAQIKQPLLQQGHHPSRFLAGKKTCSNRTPTALRNRKSRPVQTLTTPMTGNLSLLCTIFVHFYTAVYKDITTINAIQ